MKDLKGLEPLDYLGIIWRRRWYALGAFILSIACFLSYSLITPDTYSSTSLILVKRAPIPKDYVRPSEGSSPAEMIDSVRIQIRSRSFIERLIQEFQIFGYGARDDFVMDDAVVAVRNNIQVKSVSHNTLSITYSAVDAQFAQTITSRVVESLIQSNKLSRESRAIQTYQFLDEQLRQIVQDLNAQEGKIRQFKSEHLEQLPEQNSSNMSALNSLKIRLSEVENSLQDTGNQQKLLKLRAQEQELLSQSLMSSDYLLADVEMGGADFLQGTDPFLAQKQAELVELSSKYTSNHPDVIRVVKQIEDIKNRSEEESTDVLEEAMIPESGQDWNSDFGNDAFIGIESAGLNMESEMLRSEIAKYEKERKSILSQIDVYQERLELAPALEQQLSSLEREQRLLERQYTGLMNDKFQSQLTANLETNRNNDTYSIIDLANLPEKPAFPNRLHFAFIGLGCGILLGFGAAFGREILDTTFSTEEEVTAALNIPVLASIYEIPKKKMKITVKASIPKSA